MLICPNQECQLTRVDTSNMSNYKADTSLITITCKICGCQLVEEFGNDNNCKHKWYYPEVGINDYVYRQCDKCGLVEYLNSKSIGWGL